MRILHVSSVSNYGGGERHVVDLARGLTERGHEVYLALRPSNQWEDKLDFIPAENILHASIRNSFGVFSAKKIASFIKKNGIDIIHAHAARDYIPASLAARMAKGTQFVLTRHVLFPMKPFHRLLLTNLSRAIAVSPSVLDTLSKVVPKEKIVVIPNGIDVDEVTDDQRIAHRREFREFHAIPESAFVVGTVGELKELKGQRDFVLAANQAAAVNPVLYFVVVGRDNQPGQPFRRELKRLVKVFGLSDRFLWLDWTDDMPMLLSALDIFVSASHSESFGLAILEAMANRTPIVTTATEGAKQLLKHEESAVIVPIEDPVRLGEAIVSLVSQKEKAHEYSLRALDIANDEFSLSEMIDRTEALYREIRGRQSKSESAA